MWYTYMCNRYHIYVYNIYIAWGAPGGSDSKEST